ncbi:NAD+ kinase [Paracoccus liaowanqingii]|uniref:NAD+ kinase n=1 Tax=Paracoccus liaowanqingii TaxID=2560053 RepID=A0A4Z1BVM6_9RHOB|nr:ATP-NAD kinase family protein [Paracoccus liaowanqingii]TGN43386.1 NAD+ kinase [Paracoccus liaowanqingii]
MATAQRFAADPFLGFIVNPLAGLGGRVGLKGSDGKAVVQEALRRGGVPAAPQRAAIALQQIAKLFPNLAIATAGGSMGAQIARGAGFAPCVVHWPTEGDTAGIDSRLTSKALTAAGVDLILFVGGDGTARDILHAKKDHVPMLGVPAGVKMHSAVFGTSPRAAGQLAARFLAGDPAAVIRDAEVMDLDEDAIREDRISAKLYGYSLSPFEQRLSQNAKSGGRPGEEATLDAIARKVARSMRPDCLYVLGPGTTTRRVADSLGLPSTLLGVDAVVNGQLVGMDLDEAGIIGLMTGRDCLIVVGVLGGQGSLFGRGNQQISAEVIRRAGRANIIVISALEKLIALAGQPLRVDTGDSAIDTMLSGYMRILTGLGQDTLYRVQS